MKRILAFALIFTMLFTAMLGVMPAANETAGPALDIAEARLQFASNVYIEFKVAYTGIDDASTIKLSITNKAGEKKVLTAKSVNADEGYAVFQYTSLSAKEIGDNLSIKAYVEGNDACFDTVTYSALEYAIKAKAAASNSTKDQALVELLAAMLDYGAAAQTAFKNAYDYKLDADNSQSFGYGLVLVGGATDATRKTIAKIGSAVNVAADSSFFKTANTYDLYNMSFDKVTGATAVEGVARYFYYGVDSYAGRGPADIMRTGYGPVRFAGNMGNLDLDTYTGVKTEHTSISEDKYSSLQFAFTRTNHPDAYASGESEYYYYQSTDGVIDSATPFHTAVGQPGYGAMRLWGFNNSAATGITATIEPGCLMIDSGTYGGTVQTCNFTASHIGTVADWLVDGKMTVSMTVAVDSSQNTRLDAKFLSNITAGSGTVSNVFSYLTSGDKMMLPSNGGTDVGGIGNYADGFTTFHLVIDQGNQSITFYDEDGSVTTVTKSVALSLEDKLAFVFTVRGKVYINRITLSMGDIFN